jgi:hypothetical protein
MMTTKMKQTTYAMSNKSGNNGKDNTAYTAIFEQFPDEEREQLKKIWEITPDAASREPGISEEDVKHALSDVHARIQQETSSQNEDHVETNGKRLWKWIAAAAVIILGMGTGILFIPQTTTAPKGELVTVDLPDGSSVELNSGSQIWHNRLFAFSNRTLHLEGEAFFSVENGSPPFIVNANNSAIEVTGTEFNVRSWSEDPSGETEVTVSEGSVQFYPAGKPDSAVTISPGNLSKLTAKMTKPTIPSFARATSSVSSAMWWLIESSIRSRFVPAARCEPCARWSVAGSTQRSAIVEASSSVGRSIAVSGSIASPDRGDPD